MSMRNWDQWDWIGYATLAASALTLAAKEAREKLPGVQWMKFLDDTGWGFAPLVLFILASIVLIARALGWIGPADSAPFATPLASAGTKVEIEAPRIRPEFTALSEAARALYEEERSGGTLLAAVAERMSGNKNGRISQGSPNDILDFLASHIAKHIQIHGKRAPSSLFERISEQDMGRSRFTDGAKVLRDAMYDQSIYWVDLAVRTAEFEANIQRLRSLSPPSPSAAPATRALPPQPTMRLEDVVKRITGLNELPGSNEPGSAQVFDACELLREKALNRAINVFGGLNWRTTKPADYDKMVRGPIKPEFWLKNRINAIDLMGEDKRGRTVPLTGLAMSHDEDYFSIWFDENQVESIWPDR